MFNIGTSSTRQQDMTTTNGCSRNLLELSTSFFFILTSALVYDYMSSTYINTHSDINHKVYWKLFTANPGVIYTRLSGLQRLPHFDLSLIYSVTYRQLNMQSYVQVSSFSPSAPQTDVKKLLCARKCRFGKSTQ